MRITREIESMLDFIEREGYWLTDESSYLYSFEKSDGSRMTTEDLNLIFDIAVEFVPITVESDSSGYEAIVKILN